MHVFVRFLTLMIGLFSLVSQAETVVIDGEDDWAPYSSKSEQNGKLKGLAVDLVTAIFQSVGVKTEIRQVPYTKCLEDLKRPTDVVGCFDTARDGTNEEAFRWPNEPLFKAKVLIWGRQDYPHTHMGPKDLLDKKVAVTNGYEYGSEFDASPRIDKIVGASDFVLFKKLAYSRVDLAVAYEYPAKEVLNRAELASEKAQIKSVGVLSDLDLYVSFSKQHPQSRHFLELFNKGMEKIKHDGLYAKIMDEFQRKYQ